MRVDELYSHFEAILESGENPVVCVYSHEGVNGPITLISEPVPGRLELHRVEK
jgi:hypothetical protein